MSAYVALANITLVSSTSSVTFSSIPATFRDLVLVTRRITNTAANAGWIVNGDSANNYTQVFMSGSGSSATAGANSNIGSLYLDVGSSTSTEALNHIVQFMDYSATDKHKTVLSREDRADQRTSATASRWANTSAITSITIATGGGVTMSAGSTFALYGIRA